MTYKYNFNKLVNRLNSDSLKWNKYNNRNIIPLWVADSDFYSPECIRQELKKRINHGIFGYGIEPKNLSEIIVKRFLKFYNWKIDPSWIVYINGVVSGLNLSIRTFTKKNASVITYIPIYPPFIQSILLHHRIPKYIYLSHNKKKWILDPNILNSEMLGNEKLIMLCNPHNPTGSVFSYKELENILYFIKKHNLIICSDEIHCDLILQKKTKHIPFASIHPEAEQCSITFMSPSKTYNISGLNFAVAIIPNKKLRTKFILSKKKTLPNIDIFSFIAATTAWGNNQCNDWLTEQIKFLRKNRNILVNKINNISYLNILKPYATYLGWINCKNMKVTNPSLYFEKYGLKFSSGKDFGDSNFIRFNFACSRIILYKALERIEYAINKLFIS
ncbi:putative C-S lyase [Enterobacteriaceae endosymbiont of Donacia tomentosa]|uniref:MalY/PatB family protein n=1 Tax=Enterobacteriaceae endosymbiont of Donacia tomentosa TaxID=2675787 RepID=UPI00144959E8|nr:PatB family C-S lyase [Enterobacteriaceae endosymbiont of Donacia tomentosa]QJC31838.1 putative C-S lyase [Enterobacteriaceae endosymbiont of Donacia tomentosa]